MKLAGTGGTQREGGRGKPSKKRFRGLNGSISVLPNIRLTKLRGRGREKMKQKSRLWKRIYGWGGEKYKQPFEGEVPGDSPVLSNTDEIGAEEGGFTNRRKLREKIKNQLVRPLVPAERAIQNLILATLKDERAKGKGGQ